MTKDMSKKLLKAIIYSAIASVIFGLMSFICSMNVQSAFVTGLVIFEYGVIFFIPFSLMEDQKWS